MIKCRFCGKELCKLTNTHLAKHVITETEYIKKYGWTVSTEFREKLSRKNSGKNHPMYGKHHSDETKRKISTFKRTRAMTGVEQVTIDQMSSEYTKGLSLSEIGRNHKLDSKRVKRLLVKNGVDFSVSLCKRCKKPFKRTHMRDHFCKNPCVQSREREDNVLTWRIITGMRSQLWELSKSNPHDVIKLSEVMKKKEGKKFAKLVFGSILKDKRFKSLLKIYDEYHIGEKL
jgi:hypothetical protein